MGCRAGRAGLIVGGLVFAAAVAAQPGGTRTGLPVLNLSVEVRVVDEVPARPEAPSATPPPAGYTVGTQRTADPAPSPLSLALSVMNGEWAILRLGRSVPMQWVQAAAQSGQAGGASGGAGAGGGIVEAVTWMDASQGLSVRVRWPGGAHPASVSLGVNRSTIGAGDGTGLPAAQHLQTATTLVVPLGRWVSFARIAPGTASAAPPDGGRRWSTDDRDAREQWIQIRVSSD